MLHTSKPVDWDIFNCPPRHPVQYYSILKKKREFNQLIRQYDTQVFKHGYLHYCGIVPKTISSTFSDRYELFIIFFDEVPNTSFIGFRVKVSKETFIHESNSLLLFLKKSKKPLFYLMNNNCIHVQCGTNAWELFYLLYDEYLRQYVLTVIGTQFFYHFVYSFCIQKEIQLLELLFKGSKIIRVSKKSIYYKIHKKRKISVSNLIYMTLNMPKSKRCIISFNSKASLLHSDLKHENFYTCSGNKIHISKLVLKKFKKQIEDTKHDNAVKNSVVSAKVLSASNLACSHRSEKLNSRFEEHKSDIKNSHLLSRHRTLKRKLEETENDSQSGTTTTKYRKTSESVCTTGVVEDQWEQYANIKPYTVKTYSGVQCFKHSVPHLLSNGQSSHLNNSNSYLINNPSLASVQSNRASSLSSGKATDVNSDYLTYEETCEIGDHIKSISSNLHEKHESYNPENISCVSREFETLSEDYNLSKVSSLDDVHFITAAGKTINISNTAMLTARRLIEDVCDYDKQQLLQAKGSFGSNKTFQKLPSIDYNDPHEKSETKDMLLDKTCFTPHIMESLKGNEMPSKKLDSNLSESIYKNYKLDSSDNPDVIFSTAAGKTLTVSNTAMQAAQKLIQDVFQEESIIPYVATNYDTRKDKICKNTSTFQDIGFSSKSSEDKIDVDMDTTLVEKFFEDTVFDEKELEMTLESKKDKHLAVVLEPISDKNLPTCKPRKSLGGRRSMKFCSDKL